MRAARLAARQAATGLQNNAGGGLKRANLEGGVMDRVSPLWESLDDEGDDETEIDVAPVRAAGISHEFVQYAVQGLPALCWSPWRMLKIYIRARAQVCCSFAHKLPKFGWPTAKQFHDESEMWNHPYMQHMRRTIGKEDELPFCKICRETDKRDVRNADVRRDAMRETQRIAERNFGRPCG